MLFEGGVPINAIQLTLIMFKMLSSSIITVIHRVNNFR